MILAQGEEVQEIYFIISGELKIFFTYGGNKKEIKRFFKKGHYFGDSNVFEDSPAQYNYYAQTKIKLLILPKYKFILLINEYPEIR